VVGVVAREVVERLQHPEGRREVVGVDAGVLLVHRGSVRAPGQGTGILSPRAPATR
jgi:hypothetical protein